MKLQIVNKSNNPLPQYKTKGSVGMDLCAYLEESKIEKDLYASKVEKAGITPDGNTFIELSPGQRYAIPTGLYISIPKGFEAQIRPRSGLTLKEGITVLNSPGTIDYDYRGEICIIIYNASNKHICILSGDRIAQMVVCPIMKVELEEVKELDSTIRGENGFGSTGIQDNKILEYFDEDAGVTVCEEISEEDLIYSDTDIFIENDNY